MDLVVESWAQELGAMEGTEAQSLTGQEHPPRHLADSAGPLRPAGGRPKRCGC